jgi:hypothetical protein
MSDKNPDLLNVYAQPERVYNSPVCGKLTLRSCFAVGSGNAKQNERARDWATTRNNNNPRPTTRPNGGLKISIIDLESREEGGRAYKVVDQYGCMYDLRERVMLDIIKRIGITPGGGIPGTFRFVMDGSQQLLVPEDSAWIGMAERMAGKKPIKNKLPFRFYSNKKETDFYFALPGGQCIRSHTWSSGRQGFLNDPFGCSYGIDTVFPTTLYDSPIQFEFSEDPAEDFTHLLMALNLARPNYWTKVAVLKLALQLDKLDLAKELEADPSKIKKIKVSDAG